MRLTNLTNSSSCKFAAFPSVTKISHLKGEFSLELIDFWKNNAAQIRYRLEMVIFRLIRCVRFIKNCPGCLESDQS
ncbi:hypothetical protein PATA110616_12815 [Paenibacillus tarimensis]